MKVKIYDASNVLILDIEQDDTAYRSKQLMSENVLELHYSMPTYLELPVGAWCEFEAERYTLESPQNFTVQGDRNYEYKVIMYGAQSHLRRYRVRDTTIQNRLKFPYVATPRQHLSLIISNLNRHDSGWTIGDCIESAEQVINYNHISCLDALQDMSRVFNTEWEVINKTIHLRRVEYNRDAPIALRYGKNGGLLSGIERENFSGTLPCEILLVQGGSRNIDVSRYVGTELLLPKSQTIRFDGNFFEDEAGFNASVAREYIVADDGLSIQRNDKTLTSHVENSVDLSDIYPSRIGTVSAVETEQGVDDAGNPVTFYDIIDSSIPANLNFEDYLIAGETMSIIFQSGKITSRGFNVQYVHAERRFKLQPALIDGQEMPSSVFVPTVGDRYAVFGCMLPDAYIRDDVSKSGASWDMFRKAVRFLFANEDQKFTFTGELDGIFAAKNWLAIGGKIKVGGHVRFFSDKFIDGGYIDIRIVGIKTYINSPKKPVLDLSNAAVGGTSLSSSLREIGQNEVVNEERLLNLIQFTRRTFLQAKEAQEMLERALDHFTPGINPSWVRTMSILLGNEYQQFEFVNSKTEPQHEIIPNFVWNNETKVFAAPISILKHMTLGIENHTYTRKANEFKYWDVAAYISPYLAEAATAYYLVAKCSKVGTTGEFLLQPEYKYDPGDGYYYFMVGLLSSEQDGLRSFATVYGYTEILPGQMRIKLIISPDGRTYFNVAEGIIGGNIQILAGSSGYNNLSDKPDLGVFQTKAEFNVFADYISGRVTQVSTQINAQGERVTVLEQAGFITTAQGNQLFASKTLENGNTLTSIINQTATTIQIQASKVNLIGQVTFSMFDNQTQNRVTNVELGVTTALTNANAANTAVNSLRTSLGTLAYQNIVEKALLGTTIIDGGLIRTDLISTQLLLADGAYIGNFRIANGWFTAAGDMNNDVGYIDMRGTNTRIAFGRDLVPMFAGGATTCTAIINNSNQAAFGGRTIGLSVKAVGNSSNNIRATAIEMDGGLRMKGHKSIFELCPNMNVSVGSDSGNADNLLMYNTYIYQLTAGMNAFLPSISGIASAFGYFSTGETASVSGVIRITLIMTRWSTAQLTVNAHSSTPIINNNGGTVSSMNMGAGDILELMYYNGAWYTLNYRT